MEKIICCDWGTTSLRLTVYNTKEEAPIAAIAAEHGVLAVNQQFTASAGDLSRKAFFLQVLNNEISRLHDHVEVDTPLIISGMASANIGMEPLPYALLPFDLQGKDAVIRSFQDRQRPVHLVSGCRADADIMRGEETQLVGAARLMEGKWEADKQALVILPGTHSKHVVIRDQQAVSFKTYMTGEIFCLLFSKSILSQSVMQNDFSTAGCHEAFLEGVQKGLRENILHALFDVRIRSMLGQADARVNFAYLSGQMIGSELRDLSSTSVNDIVICGSEQMNEAYATAIDQVIWYGAKPRVTCVPAAMATAAGQLMMYKSHRLFNFIP